MTLKLSFIGLMTFLIFDFDSIPLTMFRRLRIQTTLTWKWFHGRLNTGSLLVGSSSLNLPEVSTLNSTVGLCHIRSEGERCASSQLRMRVCFARLLFSWQSPKLHSSFEISTHIRGRLNKRVQERLVHANFWLHPWLLGHCGSDWVGLLVFLVDYTTFLMTLHCKEVAVLFCQCCVSSILSHR